MEENAMYAVLDTRPFCLHDEGSRMITIGGYTVGLDEESLREAARIAVKECDGISGYITAFKLECVRHFIVPPKMVDNR